MVLSKLIRPSLIATTCLLVMLTAACATPPPHTPPQGVLTISDARTAVADLQPVTDSAVGGQLEVERFGNGVRISGPVRGLPGQGLYGIHIHSNGDCNATDALSAGPIFNPHNTQHGRNSHGAYMAGDMDNLVADAQGHARVEAQIPGVTLGSGEFNDIAGRSIVVHALADDYATQPEGNAGGRIACGVIHVTDPPPVAD